MEEGFICVVYVIDLLKFVVQWFDLFVVIVKKMSGISYFWVIVFEVRVDSWVCNGVFLYQFIVLVMFIDDMVNVVGFGVKMIKV